MKAIVLIYETDNTTKQHDRGAHYAPTCRSRRRCSVRGFIEDYFVNCSVVGVSALLSAYLGGCVRQDSEI